VVLSGEDNHDGYSSYSVPRILRYLLPHFTTSFPSLITNCLSIASKSPTSLTALLIFEVSILDNNSVCWFFLSIVGFFGRVGFVGALFCFLVSGFFSFFIHCFSSTTAISLSTVLLVRNQEIGKSY
jgi:hypothetical protein